MHLARRTQLLSPSPTLAITAKAKRLRQAGADIINLGGGEPDYDTPEYVKSAAIAAITEGFTKYTPPAGIPELKEAVRDKLRRDNNLEYTTEEIIICAGAKQALFNLALALFNPGDEVLLASPYWVTYPEQIKLAGATPVAVNTREDQGFQLTPEILDQELSSQTKALIINTPCNPTGAVFTKDNLLAVLRFAHENDLYIISDECYESFVYDGHGHVSIAGLDPDYKRRIIVINAVSKTYSMTGWRIGYAAGSPEIIKAMNDIQSQSTSCPASISQKAALAALIDGQSFIQNMVAEFDGRRRYLVDRLNNIPDIHCNCPQGAFYVFPNCSTLLGKKYKERTIYSSTDLADYLLEEAKVAVVPGIAFGNDDHLRLSYTSSLEELEAGLDRIEDILRKVE